MGIAEEDDGEGEGLVMFSRFVTRLINSSSFSVRIKWLEASLASASSILSILGEEDMVVSFTKISQ